MARLAEEHSIEYVDDCDEEETARWAEEHNIDYMHEFKRGGNSSVG